MQKEVKVINEAFAMVNPTTGEKVKEERKTGYEQDISNTKAEIYKQVGWHFLGKSCADYCNCSFFEIMNTPAQEVAGLAALIHQASIYNSNNQTM